MIIKNYYYDEKIYPLSLPHYYKKESYKLKKKSGGFNKAKTTAFDKYLSL